MKRNKIGWDEVRLKQTRWTIVIADPRHPSPTHPLPPHNVPAVIARLRERRVCAVALAQRADDASDEAVAGCVRVLCCLLPCRRLLPPASPAWKGVALDRQERDFCSPDPHPLAGQRPVDLSRLALCARHAWAAPVLLVGLAIALAIKPSFSFVESAQRGSLPPSASPCLFKKGWGGREESKEENDEQEEND